MADPTKRELNEALVRVLGGGVTLPLVGADSAQRKAAQGEAEFSAGMRLTRPEPEAKPEPDDAEHERAMVEHTIQSFRARADQAETEAVECYLADRPHREAELRAEAEKLRALANRHEATQRRRKGK